ncbi:MAG: hypothetical protein A2700_02235 [Candidatus Blackburnbacteria bacterium RIFCSPHIGHO2_01_FULL_44_64]|uniref:Antitoxin n=1 Tax=Candidatus Blackburnbacteria bacterium RIFCSPHIGHO2_02_FULL_44_20 TaxID=1797516 RepID=A0A1G1V598_9BACT|nr:MAG: hypothetical protein A2700_02235 [Candidatus Blackburnbacteria bacterium RIFCSPHIGHO2_01_FULL_44_64]OGY10560.1 MAG: hypothetical protein A3D26_00480 [Candidatus Blackburnbacteria bacterium RIFCSPHIGHO2_02_FULL_44_20]OGY11646.1 MAG: hypothetical protein A3E16_01455 [Candidatus Blackburnbacteria bacterium RIFCSPHIGHO2_12_FULL_44_25]OGY13908.1 MAG: hypothetical protein A3A62_02400 [Candidatus Blackburnbacteria bacterium RIFCSPLOWO2_01_FULL_44_43]
MTQTMKASEARQQWAQVLNKVFKGQTRVVVEKSGIPVAAVISTQDLKRLTQLEKQREDRFKALDRMREAFKNVPAEVLELETEKAIAEVRVDTKNTSD